MNLLQIVQVNAIELRYFVECLKQLSYEKILFKKILFKLNSKHHRLSDYIVIACLLVLVWQFIYNSY